MQCINSNQCCNIKLNRQQGRLLPYLAVAGASHTKKSGCTFRKIPDSPNILCVLLDISAVQVLAAVYFPPDSPSFLKWGTTHSFPLTRSTHLVRVWALKYTPARFSMPGNQLSRASSSLHSQNLLLTISPPGLPFSLAYEVQFHCLRNV